MSESARQDRTSDISEAKSKVWEASSNIRDGAQEIAGEVKNVASIGREIASNSINAGVEAISNKSSDLMKAISDSIRTKPMQSIAMAAGVGLLLGAFLKRSRS